MPATSQSVLIVEDDAVLRDALQSTLQSENYPAVVAKDGHEALSLMASEQIGLVVSDVHMKPIDGCELLETVRSRYPDLPMVLMTAFGTVENAVDALHRGAIDYLIKPFDIEKLTGIADRFLHNEPAIPDLVAEDRLSRKLIALAKRVAATNVTVTLSGQSGTGKEVIARYIHQHSQRSDGPFVAVNCAAIPENMLEAMLFGHEKGAFTGATKAYAGKFEQANGGTIFLDEISEMPLSLQAKLLRVLQEREVERLGASAVTSLDVRVLASTNRVLKAEVEAGNFREDLFYRLNVFPLMLPPLSARPADILPLAKRALSNVSPVSGGRPMLSPCAERALLDYSWPGNVRELENVIQRSVILANGRQITSADIEFEDTGNSQPQVSDDAPVLLKDDLLASEFKLIRDALKENGGSKKDTAVALGISPRTLRYKLARMRDAGLQLHAG